MGTSIIKIDSRTVLIQIMVAVANELLHYKHIVVSCAVATQNFRRTKPSGLALFKSYLTICIYFMILIGYEKSVINKNNSDKINVYLLMPQSHYSSRCFAMLWRCKNVKHRRTSLDIVRMFGNVHR